MAVERQSEPERGLRLSASLLRSEHSTLHRRHLPTGFSIPTTHPVCVHAFPLPAGFEAAVPAGSPIKAGTKYASVEAYNVIHANAMAVKALRGKLR